MPRESKPGPQLFGKPVLSVYSGKVGCCCGCLGKHRYASKTRLQAGKSRGYKVRDEEVSDRSVAIIFNKIKKFPAELQVVGSNNVSVTHNGRYLIAYFE